MHETKQLKESIKLFYCDLKVFSNALKNLYHIGSPVQLTTHNIISEVHNLLGPRCIITSALEGRRQLL